MEKQPLAFTRGVSCWSDVQGTSPPCSSFPVPPRPRSLLWFPSVVGGAPSFIVGCPSSFVHCGPPHSSWVVLPLFVIPGHHRVMLWLLAPMIHPASSGLWGWGWVLGRSVVMGWHGGVAAANEINIGTHHPPREQGLAAVVVGGCHCWGPRSVVVTWQPAPVIHPVSSGSQGWGRCWGHFSLLWVPL
jgi:hypothetical protein